jgi:hypothetical protein
MRTIRTILAGTAVVGALAAGLIATPAQAATSTATTAATASGPSKHFFGPYYSRYGSGESFGDRSYFKGYWYKQDGRYWFFGDLFDRDHDREYSYVWFKWHDDFGFHTSYYKTFGRKHFDRFGGFQRSRGFDDFKIRVCEGDNRFDDCGSWGDAF